MSSRLYALALLPALVAPGTGALAQTPHDTASSSYVSLHAGAEREVANDEFTAVAAVERSDRSSANTQAAVNKVMESVARAAKAAGMGFETADYQSSRIEDAVKPGSTAVPPAHWLTRASMVIKSQDLQALERFLGSVSGDVAIEQVASRLLRDTRRALAAELRKEAVAEFQNKARELAEGLGHPGYEIAEVTINDGNDPVGNFMPAAAPRAMLSAALAAPPPLTLTQGRTLVSVSVSGSIRLK